MRISKEVEIETSDFKDSDLFQELEERIENKFILHTEEHQKKMQSEVDAMVVKLAEIRKWLLGY